MVHIKISIQNLTVTSHPFGFNSKCTTYKIGLVWLGLAWVGLSWVELSWCWFGVGIDLV